MRNRTNEEIVQSLARSILATETSYTWAEAPAEVKQDCIDSAKVHLRIDS